MKMKIILVSFFSNLRRLFNGLRVIIEASGSSFSHAHLWVKLMQNHDWKLAGVSWVITIWATGKPFSCEHQCSSTTLQKVYLKLQAQELLLFSKQLAAHMWREAYFATHLRRTRVFVELRFLLVVSTINVFVNLIMRSRILPWPDKNVLTKTNYNWLLLLCNFKIGLHPSIYPRPICIWLKDQGKKIKSLPPLLSGEACERNFTTWKSQIGRSRNISNGLIKPVTSDVNSCGHWLHPLQISPACHFRPDHREISNGPH